MDSYSTDDTVDIVLSRGVHVVQRPFRGFGDQWNYAVSHLPATAPWTMKLDPDERLTDALKAEIGEKIKKEDHDAYTVPIRLFFMGKKLAAKLEFLRIWKTGACRSPDVAVKQAAG